MDILRVNSDLNGNPRYVVFWLHLAEKMNLPSKVNYEQVAKICNKYGGRKYNTKKFGGGIVFTSYNINSLIERICTSEIK